MPIIEKAAYHLGMAFQINDDIMDYCPVEEAGKPCYQDIAESKIRLPAGCVGQCGEETYRPRVVRSLDTDGKMKTKKSCGIDFVKKRRSLNMHVKSGCITTQRHKNTSAPFLLRSGGIAC